MAKKVLFLNTVAGKGSVGRLVTGLSRALRERGTESLIAYGRWDPPKGYDTYRIGCDADVYLHGALSRITDRQGLYSSAATDRLIGRIAEYEPDIIHLHNVHGYYVNYKKLFSYLKNEYSAKPGHRIIWTLHDCWSFTGHCVHFEYARCGRWKTGCHDCPEKRQYPGSFIMDASRSNYGIKKDAFTGIEGMNLVTPSVWLKERVKESFLKDYPVYTVPTGIDLSTFRPVTSDLRKRYAIEDKVVLLGAANPWRDRKGLNDFIELSRRIDSSTVIVLIGIKKSQTALFKGFDNIIPIEKTDSVQEMARWYTAADIYVNLTKEDTFPTTNIESLACGTPVITYRAGGSPESLTPDTGIVVRKDDISGVVESVGLLLGRNREETEKACLDRASGYGADIRFRQYIEDIYEKVL